MSLVDGNVTSLFIFHSQGFPSSIIKRADLFVRLNLSTNGTEAAKATKLFDIFVACEHFALDDERSVVSVARNGIHGCLR